MPALSPSRASDFMQCPLLYRFRVIDKLPEPPTQAMARGTLVHGVLENLFVSPAAERTREQAELLLAPYWEQMIAERAELADLVDHPDEDVWIARSAPLCSSSWVRRKPTV